MPNILEIIIAIIWLMCFFLFVVVIGSIVVCLQGPCKGCEHYVKDGHECLFNPLASDGPPPKQCPVESWEI